MSRNAERRPPARKAAPATNHDQAILPQNLKSDRGSHPTTVREAPELWREIFDLVGAAYRRGYNAGRAVPHA